MSPYLHGVLVLAANAGFEDSKQGFGKLLQFWTFCFCVMKNLLPQLSMFFSLGADSVSECHIHGERVYIQ